VSAASAPGGLRRTHRVLVFTTPTCPWCSRAKAYLREQHVPFREIDVSRDAAAARDLVRRTGQMGVPVIEIDGRPVVGFDRPQISRLLGLRG
jgi:glutaredoxin 3